jgi:hypothetical protein
MTHPIESVLHFPPVLPFRELGQQPMTDEVLAVGQRHDVGFLVGATHAAGDHVVALAVAGQWNAALGLGHQRVVPALVFVPGLPLVVVVCILVVHGSPPI